MANKVPARASKSKAKPPVKVRATVKLRAYEVICTALEGVGHEAIRRVYKHREDEPPETYDLIDAEVERVVMGRLCEIIDFGDSDG